MERPLPKLGSPVGGRIGHDREVLAIVASAPLKVFLRREEDLAHAVSFLPGYPDGSFGWAKVLPYLPNAAATPKLFVEYVCMGDSDKPKDYAYSTAERADLVETIWRDFSVQSTTLVAFDFSSLVVLEHLRRRLERAERGQHTGGSLIFENPMMEGPWRRVRRQARARERHRHRGGG